VSAAELADPRLPWPLRAANRLGGPLARRLSLEPEALCAAAERRTGLADFGSASFREPLGVLCRALEHEARLTALGRVSARLQLVGLLSTRLRALDLLRRRPEIEAEKVGAPIVILGMPRTGTTALQRLLSRDPRLRSLPYWEALAPLPDGDAAERAADPAPRVERARRSLRFLHWAAPRMQAMHEMDAVEPDEEIWLLALDLTTMLFEAVWNVPSFRAWYERADLRGGYGFLRRMLQVLQWYRPGERWLLKSPQHMEQLPLLFETFPDALVVQTHRDPLEVTASFASMASYGRRMNEAHPDPSAIARYWAARIETMLRRSQEGRAGLPPERFVDVRFEDIAADPLAVVRRIGEAARLAPSAEAEAAMRRWLAANPRGKHGGHSYRLEDFGLDPAELRRRMGDGLRLAG
jgi:hypothetical protein